MNCFIIDDEPRALKILESYIEKTSFIRLAGSFRDSILAMNSILTEKPDLIFLDINMPEINGIQLLKSLKNPPFVVFTTAYSDYAITSYELNAIDYLLKPIEFERFLKSATKAKEMFDLKNSNIKQAIELNDDNTEEAIFVKSGSLTYRIELSEILFIEGMGNYVNFILTDKKICSYMSLQEAIDILPARLFTRVHRSFIIAVKHIDTLEVHQIKIGKYTIPVGKSYRNTILEYTKLK